MIGSFGVFAECSIIQQSQHLQKHYLGFINGPMLFTAPHSKEVYRGGPEYGDTLRKHKREKFTAALAVEFAHAVRINGVAPYSFMVWGDITDVNYDDRDPNYLLETMFAGSQFHQSLHSFVKQNPSKALLHIDIHGKANRATCFVDIGIKSIQEHWGYSHPFVASTQSFFSSQVNFFADSDLPSCQFTTNGEFKGYWYKYKNKTKRPDRHSMTEQAIEQGIPSFQVEFPWDVRKELFNNATFFSKMVGVFEDFYQQVVIPHLPSQNATYSNAIADSYAETINSITEANEALAELIDQDS